jgi:hypothetical protein
MKPEVVHFAHHTNAGILLLRAFHICNVFLFQGHINCDGQFSVVFKTIPSPFL